MSTEMMNVTTGEMMQTNTWETMKEQASMLVKSGFLPPALNTPEKVIAVALKGKELGVPMMEAISSINIIQGKPSISPQLMLALARRTGELESFACPTNEQGATCTVKRRGQPEHTNHFGPKEALALGLSGKDNYKKQASVMYQWRAIAANLRVTFSDAVCGMYTPEEMGAEVNVNDDGSIEVKTERPTIQMPRAKSVVLEDRKSGVVNFSNTDSISRDSNSAIEDNTDNGLESEIEFGEPQSEKEKIEAKIKQAFGKGSTPITSKQRAMIFARMKQAKIPETVMRAHLKDTFGVESTENLTHDNMDDILAWLKKFEDLNEGSN